MAFWVGCVLLAKGQDRCGYSEKKFTTEQNFSGTVFHCYADFLKDTFRLGADFENAIFDTTAVFNKSTFYEKSNFMGSNFNSNAEFWYVSFNTIVSFFAVNFQEEVNFVGTNFNQNVTFFSSFQSLVRFNKSSFVKNISFNRSLFKSKADFFGVNFHSSADFSEVTFKSDINFKGTILPDTLNFSNINEIVNDIDLTVAKLDSTKKANDKNYRCKIALWGSEISKIIIDPDLFELYFIAPDTTFNQKISIYEKVLKKLHDEEFLESYTKLDKEYQAIKYRHDGQNFLNTFHSWWWDYGYSKSKVIWNSFLLLCIFTFFNLFFYERLQKNVYQIDFGFFDKADYWRSRVRMKRALLNLELSNSLWDYFRVYSNWPIIVGQLLLAFLSRYVLNPLIYTAIIFFGLKLSLENFKKFNVGTIWVMLIYVIGLFCLAYIINIIIVK